jgi:hypothetical protein
MEEYLGQQAGVARTVLRQEEDIVLLNHLGETNTVRYRRTSRSCYCLSCVFLFYVIACIAVPDLDFTLANQLAALVLVSARAFCTATFHPTQKLTAP